MINLFHVIQEKFRLKRTSIEGSIHEQFDRGYDDLIQLHEEWKEKSIRENRYYLMGSRYFKKMIEEKYPPEMIRDFILPYCMKIDSREPHIPLEVGEKVEQLANHPDMRLGMHRSDSIHQKNIYEDPVLHQILTEGLINNGAAMQGLISTSVPYPSQTISPAGDMIQACSILKSSFRGSEGAVLVLLPKNMVDISLDFERGVDRDSLYEKRGNLYYLKPEFVIGFIESRNGTCTFHSKEELLEQYKEKEI